MEILKTMNLDVVEPIANYSVTPFCSCAFNGNATCNFTNSCTFTGGQCNFSTTGNACGS